ncbi:MAG: hypothetical protein WDN46_23015 [Methylocella sp.]
MLKFKVSFTDGSIIIVLAPDAISNKEADVDASMKKVEAAARSKYKTDASVAIVEIVA